MMLLQFFEAKPKSKGFSPVPTATPAYSKVRELDDQPMDIIRRGVLGMDRA
jgi:hypothetical protein